MGISAPDSNNCVSDVIIEAEMRKHERVIIISAPLFGAVMPPQSN